MPSFETTWFRNSVAAAWAVLCAVVPTPTLAASFDCAKARTGAERLICSDTGLGARDELMATIYASALRKDADGRIKIGQREWLAKAETCDSITCLTTAYDAQIDKLLGTEGGNEAATHFFTGAPEGNHGTLDVVGPVDGFAAALLTSTFVGARGVDAGDVNAASIGGVLDMRSGLGTVTDRGCTVVFRRAGGDTWEVEQRGTCDMPQGTVYTGTYKR